MMPSVNGPRDDMLIPLVRICFTPLAVFTAIFGPLLLLAPDATETYWSWSVRPAMSAVWLGAAYTFGSVALTVMLIRGSWRATIIPVASTLPFAVVMLTATIVHNDRFFTGTVRYYAWLAIYIVLPVALTLMLLINRRRDPGPEPAELTLSTRMRAALATVGALAALLGLLLILKISTVVDAWPWQLSPLMSMVVGAWLLFLAAGGLASVVEARYVAYRYYLPAAALWFGLLLGGSLARLDDFRDAITTPLYFVTLGFAAAALTAISVRLERRLRATRPT
jgi:hypothetical protein